MTDTQSFKEAYQILKKNADSLESSEILDIDSLVHLVDESINAYKICQSRIQAVEQALQHAFDDTQLTDKFHHPQT